MYMHAFVYTHGQGKEAVFQNGCMFNQEIEPSWLRVIW